MAHKDGDITELLKATAAGDREAFNKILPLVYDQLRAIARRRLSGERKDHTLDATALVHEAYLKLVQLDRLNWQNRAQFFAVSARAMRNILIDYAIRRKAAKRGGGVQPVDIDEVPLIADERLDQLLSLNDALKRLEALDARQAQVVECRVFGGMTLPETAEALGVSEATVNRDWRTARAWLNRELMEP